MPLCNLAVYPRPLYQPAGIFNDSLLLLGRSRHPWMVHCWTQPRIAEFNSKSVCELHGSYVELDFSKVKEWNHIVTSDEVEATSKDLLLVESERLTVLLPGWPHFSRPPILTKNRFHIHSSSSPLTTNLHQQFFQSCVNLIDTCLCHGTQPIA